MLSTVRSLESVRPHFSGHETFPLRQLWLLKYTRYLQDLQRKGIDKHLDTAEAIIALGVGKNMVDAMRFWAEAAGMVKSDALELSPLGHAIFHDEKPLGLDHDCEHTATQWLVHWNLSSTPDTFTGNWILFNLVNGPISDREMLMKHFKSFCTENSFKTSDSTLKRCIEVCLRSYLPRQSTKGHMEDFIEPFLGDLDLLRPLGKEGFDFHLAYHASLPDGIFAYALVDYWQRLSNSSSTLDFNRIAHGFGSPGRVFKLDPKSVDMRLSHLEALTDGALVWTEQAGLRQVIRRDDALRDTNAFMLRMLRKAYSE